MKTIIIIITLLLLLLGACISEQLPSIKVPTITLDEKNAATETEETSTSSIPIETNVQTQEEQKSIDNTKETIVCSSNIYNCDDFSNWNEAMEVYQKCGSTDIHQLDTDHDGTPCESLSGAPIEEQTKTIASTTTTYICSSDTYNCADFKTHAEALAAFEACGGTNNDIHQLDKDNDSNPCESLK